MIRSNTYSNSRYFECFPHSGESRTSIEVKENIKNKMVTAKDRKKETIFLLSLITIEKIKSFFVFLKILFLIKKLGH